MTEPIENFPQLIYLQDLEAKLRQIPADATEWTETVTDRDGTTRTVKRPGAARQQLAAEASAAARKVVRNWGAYRAHDAQELMTAVVADVAEAAGDTELAADARETLQEWGVDAKALLSEAAPAKAATSKPLQVEVVAAAPRVHKLVRDDNGQAQTSIETDE